MTAHAGTVGRRRVAGDVAFQLVGRGMNIALGIVVTVLVVRLLGDDGFGQWATLLAITTIAGTLGELGLEQVAVARAAADSDREGHWVGALLGLRIALALPLAMATAVVVVLVSRSEEMLAAGLILTGALLVNSPTALRAVFRLRVRNDVPIMVMTVNSVLWAVAVVVIAATGGGMVALAVAMVGGFAITSLLQLVLGLRAIGGRRILRLGVWRELLRAGAVLGAATLIVGAYARIDQVLVFELAGSEDAGLYGAAYRIYDQAQALPAVAMTTLLPVVAAAHSTDATRGVALFQRATEYLAIAALPFVAFAIPAAEPAAQALFGAEFGPAAPALAILMAAFVVTAVSYPVDGMIVVLDLQRRFALNVALGLVLNVALNVVLVPHHGFVAAAVVVLLSELFILTLNGVLVTRRTGVRPHVRRLPGALAAATVMGLTVFALERVEAPLALLVGAAAIVYPMALVLLRVVGPADLQRLLGLIRDA